MKILLISSFFPYPLYSGGQVRLYNLLRNLRKKHQITLICEVRKDFNRKNLRAIARLCKKIYLVERPSQWTIKNILKTGFSLYPFLLVGHQNTEMKKIIENELSQNTYDLIHAETSYIMHNLPALNIPLFLCEHNIEYKVYSAWVKKFWFWPIRPLLYLDIIKLKWWEVYFWRKAQKVIVVSDTDQKEIHDSCGLKSELVPNGVDFDYFSKVEKKEPPVPTIVFAGSFKWFQNTDAGNYLVDKIWPKIKAKLKIAVNLKIVGNFAKEKLKNTDDPNIIIQDRVPDIRQVYSKSTLLLAPIRIGGGTKFKILESMASGLPVITTPTGVDGLGNNTNGIIVAENEDQLVDKTINLLLNPYKRDELCIQERMFIKKYYDWKDIAKRLEAVYRQV